MDKDNKNDQFDQQKPGDIKSAGEDKGKHKYEDPSGTDPERYENAGASDDNETLKKPKNHTSPDERMINPDRGEH